MKLIDLLVKELPKRGGWPKLVSRIHQDHDGDVYGWTGLSSKLLFNINIIADDCRPYGLDESIENMVTHSQYEKALAASQKPSWNGEGVPPVGCECEFISNDTSWGAVMVIGIDGDKVVFRPSGESYYGITPSERQIFRPLNHETKIKQEAIKKIKELLIFDYGDDPRVNDATFIYDAIAAGKVPGVKLED